MNLYAQWKEITERQRSQQEHDKFWTDYLEKEKSNYEYILEHHDTVIEGKLSELAEKFGMDMPTFSGFMDGINTSLVKEVELEELQEDSDIKLEIDFEKLYFNMLDAKADWLYGLEQWEAILSKERRDEITKEFKRSKIAVSNKIGRNDPCVCGSGLKYKKCCGK